MPSMDNVCLGIIGHAALVIERQNLLCRVTIAVEVGHQKKRMKQQIIGIFLHEQYRAPR